MTDIEAIITLARKYSQENFSYWINKYSKERTGNDFPYTYSNSDYDLFPRYSVLSAILEDVETLVDQNFKDIEKCKAELIHIGLTAQSPFTTGEKNEIEQNAIKDERSKFVDYIVNLTSNELLSVDPLPHRRRFRDEEAGQIRKSLLEK
ncbi:MAG TPA: hypothetical protein VK644_14445 [Chitinophagaceae bacterium]|nr:hypothetical protein [Chitinophagaceae bacterium]